MATTLKESTVISQWTTMVNGAAASANALLEDVQARLAAAQIPGECDWDLEEVQSSAWMARVQREFLLVRLKQFKDYRFYVASRAYGIHLDVGWFLTVEPGFFKKKLSERLWDGDGQALSAPKNILLEQDLRAWVTVVHRCVRSAVVALADELGQDRGQIRRGSRGFLEVW